MQTEETTRNESKAQAEEPKPCWGCGGSGEALDVASCRSKDDLGFPMKREPAQCVICFGTGYAFPPHPNPNWRPSANVLIAWAIKHGALGSKR